MMPYELPCEIYRMCKCLQRPPGAVWALALRRGYITIWVDFQGAIPVFCARSSLPVPLGTLDSAQTISPARPGQY